MKSVLPLSNVCCTFIQTKQTGQPMSDTRINRQKFTMEMPSDFWFPIGRWMESMVIAWGQINHALVQIVFLKMPKMRLVRAVDGCGSKRKKTWINVCSCEHACAQHWKLVSYLAIVYFYGWSIFAAIHGTEKMLQVIIYTFDLWARKCKIINRNSECDKWIKSVEKLTCSIWWPLANPKWSTVPSTGDTMQLAVEIVRTPGRNWRVKNWEILR